MFISQILQYTVSLTLIAQVPRDSSGSVEARLLSLCRPVAEVHPEKKIRLILTSSSGDENASPRDKSIRNGSDKTIGRGSAVAPEVRARFADMVKANVMLVER